MPSQTTLKPLRIATISTSDRTAFKSCRRKWNWSSPLRSSLSPITQRHPLWFGLGMHHALEDYHGYRLYPTTDAAVDDYIQATVAYYGADNLPSSLEDDVILMKRMLAHYTIGWLKLGKRDELRTYKVNGVPQVEVPFAFEIPLPKEVLQKASYDKVVYTGIIDRVIHDPETDTLWIQDYKNISRFTNPEHLELDQQIGVYLWMAHSLYKKPIAGFVYTQLLKKGPEAPRILKDGTISTDQTQATTHTLYRRSLIDKYGDAPTKWPEKNLSMLNYLASTEEPEADKFIRRDRVHRSMKTMAAEAQKVIAELTDMLNPDLPLYPTPNYMCPVMCSFMEPCLRMDRGEPYSGLLETDYAKIAYNQRNEWRKNLKIGSKVEKPVVTIRPATPTPPTPTKPTKPTVKAPRNAKR